MSTSSSLSCPHCQSAVLDPIVRAGIEVDVCPTCRGVWLDRGELDRLLGVITSADQAEGANVVPDEFAPRPSPFGTDGKHDDDDRDDADDRDDDDDRPDRDRRKDKDKNKNKNKNKNKDRDRAKERDKDRKKSKDNKRSKKRKKRSITYLIGEAFEEVFDL